MEFRLNSRRFLHEISVNPEGKNNNSSQDGKTESKKSFASNWAIENIDVSSRDIMANYGKAGIRLSNCRYNLPEGLSEYRYKDSRYTIYKRGERYRSEFIGRHGIDKAEFFSHFDNLEVRPKRVNKQSYSSSTISDVNGQIDRQVIQGDTGDCWLLTALTSMSSTEEGRKIISESITVNDNNTVTVVFKGVGVSYTLTADEIAKYDTDNNISDSYSNGDNDVLVMELAVEKLWKDINAGKVFLNTYNEDITYTDWSIDGGGLPTQLIYYLTGIEGREYYNDDLADLSKNTVYKVLQNALENGNTAINFGIYYNEHSAKLTDGSVYSLDVEDGGHALAVTGITSDTVTFVNPWDSSEEYTMTWSEFVSLGIGYMSSADLTKTNYASEIKDMSDNSDNIKYYDDSEWNISDYSKEFDDFEPLTPSYFDDDFSPSPFEPKGADGYNSFIDDDISSYKYDYNYDNPKNDIWSFNIFSIDDIFREFLEFFMNFFARYV